MIESELQLTNINMINGYGTDTLEKQQISGVAENSLHCSLTAAHIVEELEILRTNMKTRKPHSEI